MIAQSFVSINYDLNKLWQKTYAITWTVTLTLLLHFPGRKKNPGWEQQTNLDVVTSEFLQRIGINEQRPSFCKNPPSGARLPCGDLTRAGHHSFRGDRCSELPKRSLKCVQPIILKENTEGFSIYSLLTLKVRPCVSTRCQGWGKAVPLRIYSKSVDLQSSSRKWFKHKHHNNWNLTQIQIIDVHVYGP